MSKWLTIADVSREMGVSRHSVLAWIYNGDLKAVDVATSVNAKRRRWRISREALTDFQTIRKSRTASKSVRRRPIPGLRVRKFSVQ